MRYLIQDSHKTLRNATENLIKTLILIAVLKIIVKHVESIICHN